MPINLIAHVYNPDNQSKAQLIDAFVIRKKQLNRLFSEINVPKDKFPIQHFLMEAKRGMGKTTLLLRLKYAVEDDLDLQPWLIPLMFKEEMYRINTLAKFWEEVAKNLEDEQPSFTGLYASMDAAYQDLKDKSYYDEVCYQLLLAALKKADKKLVLFIDNFGDYLRRFSDIEMQRFRATLQAEKHIGIVAATAKTIEAVHDYKNPFYEFFRTWRLEGLNKADTQALLLKLDEIYKVDNVQYILNHYPQRVEALRRLTGGVVRTIILLFEIFTDDRDGSAFHDLEALLDRVTPLYKHRMDDLATQQQEIIHELAMAWDAVNVKELAQKTRIESKVLSAQLAQLYRSGEAEKIETGTKNHLYYIDERFFNIWYLMRFGRKGDKNKIIWLTRFFEEWCDKDELTKRTKKHINALKSGDYDTSAAFYMTQAFANTKHIDTELQHELLEITREYVAKKGATDLAEMLQKSDLSLAEEAEALYETNEDYKNILKRLLEVTENNQNNNKIAYCYNKLKDYKKAEKYFLKAIDAGNNNALFNLGLLYDDKLKDYAKAEKYYLKAIDAGDNEALNNLAILYKNEYKDYAKAEKYYLKAIEIGDNDALYNLALLYKNEYKDFEKAEIYYLKAIDAGDNKALNNLGWLYHTEYKDYEKAEIYYLKAIDAGENRALNNLATLYEKEYKDFDKAKVLYEKEIAKDNKAIFNDYAWLLFEYFTNEKENALIYAQKAVENEATIHTLHTLSCIQLWNNQPEASFETANQFLYDEKSIEDFDKDYQTFLLLAIAKKQYAFVYDYFMGERGKKIQSKDRFKPIWYALMHYMREEHPIEYLRMGSELKETVEEIVAKIDEMSVKYV